MNKLFYPALTGLLLSFYAAEAHCYEQTTTAAMQIQSPAFSHQGAIPKTFTCDGRNISPALSWSGLPEAAKSLALIVYDPDVPTPLLPIKTFTHWVLYNISPTVAGLPEHVAAGDLPEGSLQGKNDWQKTGYGGPCPPLGKHRYIFKLYALDTVLPDLNQPSKKALEKAMLAHVIAEAELTGTYQR